MDVLLRYRRCIALAAATVSLLPPGRAANATAQESPPIMPDDSNVPAFPEAEPNSAAGCRAFKPFVVVTAEAWQTTGRRKGGYWADALVDFGVEIDTDQLGGPPASAVTVQAQWMRNQRRDAVFSDYTGAFNPVSNIFASDRSRVFNLYYRQSWHEGSSALKVGQIAIDDDFMRSAYSGPFLNPAFGPSPSQVGVPLCFRCRHASAFPIYPLAAPGLWLGMHSSHAFSWQSGIYYGRPGNDTPENRGFDWKSSGAHAGAAVFTEADWSYDAEGHPAALRVGGTYHAGQFDDYGAEPAKTTVRGLYSFYLIHDLALIGNPAGNTTLGVFGRLGLSPQRDRSIVTGYFDTGLHWQGPFGVRPDDVAGAAFSLLQFGRSFRRAADSEGPAASEATVELTYKVQLTPHAVVQADVQWLLNASASTPGTRTTAAAVGIRTQFSF